MAATGRVICRWGPGRKRWRRSPKPSAHRPWRRASTCWAARRGDSTASKPGTRLDVRISAGGKPGDVQPRSLPRTHGAEPVHLLAPAEGLAGVYCEWRHSKNAETAKALLLSLVGCGFSLRTRITPLG